MIIAIDVETYKKEKDGFRPILDATGKYFVLGGIKKETGGKEIFYDKEEMWNRIIELGEKELKRNKRLHVYGHNIKYDFYNIANIKDKNLKWFSENPFIASYMKELKKEFKNEKELEKWKYYAKIEGIEYKETKELEVKYKKEIIKFSDSMSIYRMSLKKMGEIIGKEKKELPKEIKKKNLKKEDLKGLEEYCINDCEIVLEGIKKIKRKLTEDNIRIRNLCTINQIAINYVMNEIKRREADGLLVKLKDDEFSKWTFKTKFPKEIHQAYRASLNRVWKVGKFENVCYSDKNSLYPYAVTKIDIPDLRTEIKIERPDKKITKEIGISKVMLLNKEDEIGLIPIRTIERSYVPLKGKYIIGIYTNMEIREALKNGYELIDIEWSIIYKKGKNILKEIYESLYKKRKENNDKFNLFFYKSIMNSSLGKFGQRRTNQELCIDSIENIEKYLKMKGEVIKGIDGTADVLYRITLSDKPKPYYAPIIPCLVTAFSRIYMYNTFKRIGKESLLYSDTDSCITIGDHRKEIKINEGLNGWKIEKDEITKEELSNANAIIWGSKAKSVGNNITVSGAFKGDLRMEDFEKGKAKSQKMIGIRNAQENETGKIIKENKDLEKQKENFLKTEELLEKETLFIDKDITDISYFIPKIDGITFEEGIEKV